MTLLTLLTEGSCKSELLPLFILRHLDLKFNTHFDQLVSSWQKGGGGEREIEIDRQREEGAGRQRQRQRDIQTNRQAVRRLGKQTEDVLINY